MAHVCVILATTFAMLAAGTAQADDMILQPSSSWTIIRSPEMCTLGRSFGSGENEVVLQFQQAEPSAYLQAAMLGQPLKRVSPRQGVTFDPKKFAVVFGPAFEPSDVGFRSYSTDGGSRATFFTARIDPAVEPLQTAADSGFLTGPWSWDDFATERMEAVSWLSVHRGGRDRLTLQFDDFSAAIGLLDKCMEQLIDSWGVDVAVHRAGLSRRASISNSGDMLRAFELDQRTDSIRWVDYRLIVSATGEVEGCAVLDGVNDEAERERICAILTESAQVEPALGADGTPVKSFIRTIAAIQVTNFY